MDKEPLVIFWFRRDLRIADNAALYHALKSGLQVLPLFIFDSDILDKLHNPADARVTFIYQEIEKLKTQLEEKHHSSLLVKHGKPNDVWANLLKSYNIKSVYCNHDYEPEAIERDEAVKQL